jgi:hypothetical protein
MSIAWQTIRAPVRGGAGPQVMKVFPDPLTANVERLRRGKGVQPSLFFRFWVFKKNEFFDLLGPLRFSILRGKSSNKLPRTLFASLSSLDFVQFTMFKTVLIATLAVSAFGT